MIKSLASAALNKAFCLPVKIGERAGKGLGRAYRAGLGPAEGTAYALFELCASLAGNVDIRSRYAKGREREPYLAIYPDLQAGSVAGSGFDSRLERIDVKQ